MPGQCDAVGGSQTPRRPPERDAGKLPDGPQEGFTSSLQLLTRGLLLSIRVC
jgi:hypothetical protein